MTVGSSPSKMTYQDLLRLPEDLLRHELIEGEHIVSAGAPDLAIEVLSPSSARIDKVRKLRLYERHGVREYWLADPAMVVPTA